MSRLYGQTPTCHPERKHASGGLCSACYQRKRYQTCPEYRNARLGHTRRRRKAFYAANRERILIKQRAYYSMHRETEIAKAVARNRIRFHRDPASYQQMLKNRAAVRLVMRQRRKRTETPISELPRETPVGTPPDMEWYRTKVADRPRAWLINA